MKKNLIFKGKKKSPSRENNALGRIERCYFPSAFLTSSFFFCFWSQLLFEERESFSLNRGFSLNNKYSCILRSRLLPSLFKEIYFSCCSSREASIVVFSKYKTPVYQENFCHDFKSLDPTAQPWGISSYFLGGNLKLFR